MEYIYQHNDWPNFFWDNEKIAILLSNVHLEQGKLIGKMHALGFEIQNEGIVETLTMEIIKTSEIEGENINLAQVRSSLCRKLGVEAASLVQSDRDVDGLVDMLIDATLYADNPLTADRLFNWHGALFPTGRSGLYKIVTANWRNDANGPMQVVSGPVHKLKVHFQAPDAKKIKKEMNKFFKWLNSSKNIDSILQAAIAHLWFITLHPFEDGNGRLARAITELMLTRSDKSPQRFYGMSNQINIERNLYYNILEKTQKGNLDITNWLIWFLECLHKSILSSENTLSSVLKKATFWQENMFISLNERQHKMINKLFDGFDGKLNTSKWAKISKCSSDTALRDIQDLVDKQILIREAGGGRSTSYLLNQF